MGARAAESAFAYINQVVKQMKTIKRRLAVPIMIVLALTAGCNRGGETSKPATQVAAKVNSTEITVSQINNVLSRMPNVAPENSERAKREILDRLIDAELAKEEAIAKKLDRSPAVVQQFEAAKTELLARAYVEQFASQQPKPSQLSETAGLSSGQSCWSARKAGPQRCADQYKH